MSKLLVRRAERAPRKVEQDVIEVMEPDTEISASGGKARVKSRRASFEDGKLTRRRSRASWIAAPTSRW